MKFRKLSIPLLINAFALLLLASAHAQTLVYSLCYSETQASRQIRFPSGALGASTKAALAMLRGCSKSEVYSVSFPDGNTSLLFSDDGMDLEFWPTGPVLGRDKIYGTGFLREWRTAPTPGAHSEPPTLYELSLDGSHELRKIIELPASQPEIAINRQGTRAAIRSSNENDLISIYELPGWRLLRTWELSKIIAAHCPDCALVTYAWLADGRRLLCNIVVVGDEDEAGNDHPGTYIVGEDGSDLGALPLPKFELEGYVHPKFVEPRLLAQLPDGDYLFDDAAAKKDGPMGNLESFLVISGTSARSQKIIPRKRASLRYSCSSSGKYLAYIEERLVAGYKTERHLWAIDLETGAEKELFVLPPPGPPSSPKPNVSLRIVGWISEN